ncbi:hypothetical protein B0H12DRAFT_1125520 [Mycena haematopus]|nr:hypothetical protein B0H12DRAFT_1125520 [Mycena haematopus]
MPSILFSALFFWPRLLRTPSLHSHSNRHPSESAHPPSPRSFTHLALKYTVMSSHDTQLSSLSACKFSRLATVLRKTNEHYSAVAHSTRAVTRPTYHARTHARKLGLAVDTRSSVHPNCPEGKVFIRPLPALERPLSASPTASNLVLQLTKPVIRQHKRGGSSLRLTAQGDGPTSSSSDCHTPAQIAGTSPALRLQNDPTLHSSITPNDPACPLACLLPSLLEYEDPDGSLFSQRACPAHKPEEPLMSLPQLLFDFLSESPVSSSGRAKANDIDVIIPGLPSSAAKRKRAVLDLEEANFVGDKRPKCTHEFRPREQTSSSVNCSMHTS